MMKLTLVVCALVASSALAVPVQEPVQPSLLEQAYGVYSSCAQDQDLTTCLKLKALRLVDRAARAAEIVVADGVKIVASEDQAKATSRADGGRSLNDIEAALPAEAEARESAVNEALLDRAGRFLAGHTLELSMPEEVSRSLGEARGKKKKVMKSLMPILLLLKLKAAALIPILLGGLALLAFKAFIAGKLALIISGVMALQKLFANRHQNYEVLSHELPHQEHHAAGWARSLELPYSAHKPTSTA